MATGCALSLYWVWKKIVVRRTPPMDQQLKNALTVERTVLEEQMRAYNEKKDNYTTRIGQLEIMVEFVRAKLNECRNEVKLINEQLQGKGASNGG